MLKTATLEKIKCTPAERAAVELVARRDGIKMPEARRLLIRRGAQHLGVWKDALAQFEPPLTQGHALVDPGEYTTE